VATERFEWYYMGESGQIGPLSDTQIFDLADHAAISGETLIWKVGMDSWKPANSVPALSSRIKPQWSPPVVPTPPPPPAHAATNTQAVCPRDGTALKRESRSGIEIDWCPNCRGVWLDRGELEKLIDRESDDDRREERDDDDRRPRRRRGFFGDVFDVFD
jgi:uncharacterized protein